MNATSHSKSDGLEAYVTAVRDQFDDAEINAAANRVREGLPTIEREDSRSFSFKTWASGLAAAAVVAVIFPLLSPTGGGVAFAQVQEWFESYQTLQLIMTTEHRGKTLTRLEVLADADGNTRIDTQGTTQIIDPLNGEMLILLPGKRFMTQTIAPVQPGRVEALEWLDEIREFQGTAEMIDATREIDGEPATGFQLDVSNVNTTLWVATADGRPLELQLEMEGDVRMIGQFTFDELLPDDAFVVPSDYVLLGRDNEE